MADSSAKSKTEAEGDDESMEEILQSIKRIIAEEEEEGTTEVKEEDKTEEKPFAAGSDVLELTEAVGDDGSVSNVKKEEAPEDKGGDSAPMPKVDDTAPGADPLAAIDQLVSNETAKATTAALKSLAEQAPKEEPKPAAPRTPSASFRAGHTVEDLVVEALKPMLREWLDANLPGMVENIVQREIKKLTSSF